MSPTTFLILILAILVFYANAEEDELTLFAKQSDVILVNEGSLNLVVSTQKVVIVLFCTPWNGVCKAHEPEYEEASTPLKLMDVPALAVNCYVERDLCSKEMIVDYPTIKIYRDGTPSIYKGSRHPEEIISTIRKTLLPAVSILDGEELKRFSTSEKMVTVGFFESVKSPSFSNFSMVAETLRDKHVFAATFDPASIQKFNAKTPSLQIFKKYDSGSDSFTGRFSIENITFFINSNAFPIMEELGEDNYPEYLARGLPMAYFFHSSTEERSKYFDFFKGIAEKYKGHVSFVAIDANQFGNHANTLNLKKSWPAFAIQNSTYKYPYRGEFVKEDLEAFVDNVFSGKAKYSIKSEQPYEGEKDGDDEVINVVGMNYEQIVLDDEKDVFIQIYAPWCTFCKDLAPTWSELASKLDPIDNVVIAKFDGTKNDIPPYSPFKPTPYPLLKLYKAKTNEIIGFEGSRTFEKLLAFLQANATYGQEIKALLEEESKATSNADWESAYVDVDEGLNERDETNNHDEL
ncbi:protein disulfide-isomerase precursor [Nowakowskiella sp. JEL0407]|nr:protein disulfide-isomerase precursor [Nowakowskiella sp. JEL0407]